MAAARTAPRPRAVPESAKAPAGTTGTGFGPGFVGFVLLTLLVLAIPFACATLLQYQVLQDAYPLIAAALAGVVLLGITVYAWLTYHAGRVAGVRDMTIGRAMGAALLQAFVVPLAIVFGDTGRAFVPMPEHLAFIVPLSAAFIASCICLRLGLRGSLISTVATAVLVFAAPAGAVVAAGMLRPEAVSQLTTSRQYLLSRGIAWMQAHNLHFALLKYQEAQSGLLPKTPEQLRAAVPMNVDTPAQLKTEDPPYADRLLPLDRVRDGFRFVSGWPTEPGGVAVGEIEDRPNLVLAYTAPGVLPSRMTPWQELVSPSTQPAESTDPANAAPTQLERVVLMADGKVRFWSDEKLAEGIASTKQALAARTGKPIVGDDLPMPVTEEVVPAAKPKARAAATPAAAPQSTPKAQPQARPTRVPTPRPTPRAQVARPTPASQ